MSTKEQQHSHLYAGFRHAGKLPSIEEQRIIQTRVIDGLVGAGLPAGRLLSVGVAWGDELRFFLLGSGVHSFQGIDTIDMAVGPSKSIAAMRGEFRMGHSLTFRRMDLRHLHRHPSFGRWSVIQCSFVLEDIDYASKKEAYECLYAGLRPGGALLISEMYMDNRQTQGAKEVRRRSAVRRLYGRFLREADRCCKTSRLTPMAYRALCGNGSGPGILASRFGALAGERDFFETIAQVKRHCRLCGFTTVACRHNPKHPFLAVIVATKTTEEAGAPKTAGSQ